VQPAAADMECYDMKGRDILNTRPQHILAILFLCFTGTGCSSADLDFCSLLSLSEVMELDPDVESSRMGIAGESAPTHYCFYRDSNNVDVFQFSMGNPTRNPPYKILQTYLGHMEGDNNVEHIEGVGNSAAALFSDEYETDKFRILIANGDKWSVTIRAKNIDDVSSEKFPVLKELANKALSRF
jgi:hypothetical protein